jgi:hypothetical protein
MKKFKKKNDLLLFIYRLIIITDMSICKLTFFTELKHF